jgi:hypothetical protein
MALTDVKIRGAKPSEKAYRLADSGGLYLLILETGSKLWRWNYRFGGKQKTISTISSQTLSRCSRSLRHFS